MFKKKKGIQGKEACDLVLLRWSRCSSQQASNTSLSLDPLVPSRPPMGPSHGNPSWGLWTLWLPSVMVTMGSCPIWQLYTHSLLQPHSTMQSSWAGSFLYGSSLTSMESARPPCPGRWPRIAWLADECDSSSPGLQLKFLWNNLLNSLLSYRGWGEWWLLVFPLPTCVQLLF